MTPQEQKDYWLKFHRFQQRYEKYYIPSINRVLRAQVKQYLDGGMTAIDSAGMFRVLLELWKDTGSVWARHSRGLLRKDGQMGFSERMFQLMRDYFSIDLLNDAENITQTTRNLIQDVLNRAIAEGLSLDDIVDELTRYDFTRNRARLIARTETVGAANAAAVINAEQSGITLNKIWIAAKDHRTRDHHREVNQTVLPLEAAFNVGGYLMKYPGDKAGGASEVCNCRCVLGFIPVN